MHDSIRRHVVFIDTAHLSGHIAAHLAGSITKGVVEAGTVEGGLRQADLSTGAKVKAEHGLDVDWAAVHIRERTWPVTDEVVEGATLEKERES